MIPVQLNLRNFLSYGDDTVTLDFSGFRVACLSGDNGHGKSALLDGLTYALWGEGRKGRSERKADEGLLRLGTTEMEVSLVFDLDTDRYLVMRRFTKRNKRSVTELDLQVFDPLTERFRPLSDSSSAINTQRQIDSLLCMDYATFVNSAFILQGRASEFTQKTPRERKQVLAEILGLSRYDRLQQLAREKLNLRATEVRNCDSRIGELDDELNRMDDHEAALEQIVEQLEHLDARIELTGREEQVAAQTLLEIQAGMEEEARMRSERPLLAQRLVGLRAEGDDLKRRAHDNDAMLDAAASIEADFKTFQTLKSEENELAEKSQQRWQLAQTKTQLEGDIRDIQHGYERERERFCTQKATLVQQLAHSDVLISEASRIDSAYAQLGACRQEEDSLKVAQQQTIELEVERKKLMLEIESTRQGLETEREMVRNRHAELLLLLHQQPHIEEELASAESELDSLRAQAESLETLREQDAALSAEIDQARQNLETTRQRLSEMTSSARTLSDAVDAECPLCGSTLDMAHRQQLGVEMSQRESEYQRQIHQLGDAIEAKVTQRATRRAEYDQLRRHAARILPLQTKAAQLKARFEQLGAIRAEAERLIARESEINGQLANHDYAALEQRQLVTLGQRLEQQDFSIDRLQQVQRTLRELGEADADYRLLQEAGASKRRVVAELGRAEQELERAERILREEAFAGPERSQLMQVLQAFAELGYDPNRHESIRTHLSDLAQVVQLAERLDSARQSQQGVKARLETLRDEVSSEEEKLESLDRILAVSRGQESARTELESRLLAAQAQQKKLQAERDQRLERRGSVEGSLQRCRQLSTQRDELRTRMAAAQRERWIYDRLDEAFGKDGIQALIIEGVIPEIEQEANAILGRLTDNRIQISLESLKDLKSGATRETLDIVIADELGERAHSLYSGGEAFRTNFSLRVALSKVLARRAGTRLRTLIIDEGFGTQDSKGLESMIEAIQEISHDFDKILVVTHLPMLRDAFPTQIQVSKDPQYGSTLQLIQSQAW